MPIIPASPEHAEILAAIIRDSHRDVAARFHLTRDNNPKHPSFCTAEWVLSDLERGAGYFMYMKKETPAGCVAFEPADPEIAYLNRLSVLPPYRRDGIGAALVAHVISRAAADRIPSVSIGIIAAHEELKRWYLKLGFVEKETVTIPHLPFDVTYLRHLQASVKNG